MQPGPSGSPVSPSPARSDPFLGIDADLAQLPDLALSDQVVVFSRLHTALTTALAATGDAGSGGR